MVLTKASSASHATSAAETIGLMYVELYNGMVQLKSEINACICIYYLQLYVLTYICLYLLECTGEPYEILVQRGEQCEECLCRGANTICQG